MQLTFNTSQEAVNFAKSNGWNFEMKAPTSKIFHEPGSNSYADNFLPRKVQTLLFFSKDISEHKYFTCLCLPQLFVDLLCRGYL